MRLQEVRDIVCRVFGGYEETYPGVLDCGCFLIVFKKGRASVEPDECAVRDIKDPEALRLALEALASGLR